MRFFIGLLLSILTISATAQTKFATITGTVVDENEAPLKNVSIIILGKNSGVVTADNGTFSLKVPAQKTLALIFSYTGYVDQQKNFFLSNAETETILIQLKQSGKTLDAVTVGNEKERKETGLIKINPRNAIINPSTVGGKV